MIPSGWYPTLEIFQVSRGCWWWNNCINLRTWWRGLSLEAYVSSFNIILLISRWCLSCLSALYSYAAYYRGAMGILLVYDVTDESSFNSKFSYCLTFSLRIWRNFNILSILLLFYCQCVVCIFCLWVWVTSNICFLFASCFIGMDLWKISLQI